MKTFGLLLLFLGFASGVWAGSVGNAVEVQIRSENGQMLQFYPVAASSSKVYAEAVKGDQYSIVVRNRLNRRVGIVVAVDGRNIVSGQKSWLKSNERMYILEPYGEGVYSGWRTDMDRINRFYFTTTADSYAAAFKDESAMGVIAVAVYPEVQRYAPKAELSYQPNMGAPAPSRSDTPKKHAKKSAEQGAAYGALDAMESAGTGYGRQEYSPTRVVAFEAESRPVERIYIKYEWHATLCRLGIIPPDQPVHPRPNRLWDNGGFAPPPPRKG